jgi:hypothetical protein
MLQTVAAIGKGKIEIAKAGALGGRQESPTQQPDSGL